MFKKLLNWFDGGYDREFYQKHQDDIQKSNSRIIGIGLMTIALFLIVFIVLDSLIADFHIHTISFTIMLGVILALFFVHTTLTKNSYVSTTVLGSVLIVLFNIFLIIEETYFMPNTNAIIYFVFMIAVPITIIAPVYATLNINVLSFIAFAIMSYLNKNISLFYLDLMFGICCLISGTLLGRRITISKFESMEFSDKLRYQSRYDSLTNIYNRRAGHKKLEEIMEIENRISLAMVDIDDFKLYNDTYGHVKGDEVLRTIAGIFLYHVKRYGFFVSRFGGEEFVVVTYGERADLMKKILEDSAKDMHLANLVDKNSKYGEVTFSAGYTATDDVKDVEKMVNAADKALYIAKEQGKNAIVFCEIDKE